MKNRMTMNQLSTYLPFWEEMEKRLSKSIERKEGLAEVESILNRAYMKALEVGFKEGVKNMYTAQDMEAFFSWATNNGWSYGELTESWYNDEEDLEGFEIVDVLKLWKEQK